MESDNIRSLTCSFLGDIALNGQFPALYKSGKNPFKVMEPVLSGKDFVIGNVECMAKGGVGVNVLKAPRLTTTTETLNYLNNIHLHVACLANNHIYDHLYDGFKKTVHFLDKQSIRHLGASFTAEGASAPVILTKNEIKIGLLNYVTHDTNPNLPGDAEIFLNYFEPERVLKDIRQLKDKVHHVVVNLHWGGRVEGGLYPDYDQPEIARKLIDEGADLIIGHHSHTFQPYEVYNGKYIFYSIGNYCFSDHWFEGKYHPLITRRKVSGIVDVVFTQSSYEVSVNFFRNQITHFEPIDNYSLKRQHRFFRVLQSNKIFWGLYFIYHKKIEPALLFLNRSDITQKEKLSRMIRSFLKKIKA